MIILLFVKVAEIVTSNNYMYNLINKEKGMVNPRVIFNIYPTAFGCPGGGEIQLMKSYGELKKKGVDVKLHDIWNPHFEQSNVLHHFAMLAGSEVIMDYCKSIGMKVALSPIFWPIGPRENYDFTTLTHYMDNADILFTNSDIESERISSTFYIDKAKFHKTRNSVDELFFEKVEGDLFREKFSIKGDFVLSVANFERRKNLDRLLEACDHLGLTLYSIGHIREPEYFESCEKKYSNLKYIGPLEHSDPLLRSAMSACSVYALPSICETPGLAAMEAAAQGAKVVITSEGAAPEYFLDHVHYVDPLSTSSIIDGLQKELSMERDEKLRSHMLNNYTWDRTADDIIEGYNKIL